MSTQQAKAQHYIPQFYLKGFTFQKKLWVFENGKPPRASRPQDEAHRPDYYTHSETGERNEQVEDILKRVESLAAPIIRKLANPQYVLTEDNAEYVLIFVAFMFARVPAWREYLDKMAVGIARHHQVKTASDKAKFEKLCMEVEKHTGKKMGPYEALRQHILRGDYELSQQSVGFNLGGMMTSANAIIEMLKEFDYRVLYAPRGCNFCTSDSPVYTLMPEGTGEATVGMGFGWPGVEVYFPLNKNACLKLRRQQGSGGFLITEKKVEEINRVTMGTATRHLYACQGFRRTSRLFDQCGCRMSPGNRTFMPRSPEQYKYAPS